MNVFDILGGIKLGGQAGFLREVVVISNYRQPDEKRISAKGVVQGTQGIFPVETKIYEGDVVEVPDPRGGVRRVIVATVKIHEGSGIADNIEVTFGGTPV